MVLIMVLHAHLSLSLLACSSVHIMTASLCNFWLRRETGLFFAALVSDISTETHKRKQGEINSSVNTDLREFIIKCDTKELVSEANAWEEEIFLFVCTVRAFTVCFQLFYFSSGFCRLPPGNPHLPIWPFCNFKNCKKWAIQQLRKKGSFKFWSKQKIHPSFYPFPSEFQADTEIALFYFPTACFAVLCAFHFTVYYRSILPFGLLLF